MQYKISELNESNFDYNTIYCYILGYLDLIRVIVELGANINAQDKDNHTPLFYALENGNCYYTPSDFEKKLYN